MITFNRHGHAAITDDARISQAIQDVLSTPVGSRVYLREYGSLLPQLIDQPADKRTILRCISASASAIARWVPEVVVTNIKVHMPTAGKVTITIDRSNASPLAVNIGGGL